MGIVVSTNTSFLLPLALLVAAKIWGKNVDIAASAKVWYPPNLKLHEAVFIGPYVELYCVAPIEIGARSIVSQYSYLCSASHDYRQDGMPLVAKPICVGETTWICAKAFIGPGVDIGANCVVGAGAVVIKNIAHHSLAVGNPAVVVKTITPSETAS